MYNIFYFVIGFLLIVGITETILSAKWIKWYFVKAIPIHAKEIEISDVEKTEKRIRSFISQIDKTDGFSRYKGFIADEGLFFFRPKIFQMGRKSPGLHGTITIDTENRIIKVKGNLSYSLLSFVIYMCTFILSVPGKDLFEKILPVLFLIFILTISYLIEHREFKKLVTELQYAINRY